MKNKQDILNGQKKDEILSILIGTVIVLLIMALITLSIVTFKLYKETQHGKDDNTTEIKTSSVNAPAGQKQTFNWQGKNI